MSTYNKRFKPYTGASSYKRPVTYSRYKTTKYASYADRYGRRQNYTTPYRKKSGSKYGDHYYMKKTGENSYEKIPKHGWVRVINKKGYVNFLRAPTAGYAAEQFVKEALIKGYDKFKAADEDVQNSLTNAMVKIDAIDIQQI